MWSSSAVNHERIDESGIGCVGSLPPSDHRDLLAPPRRRYTDVDKHRRDLAAYRWQTEVESGFRQMKDTHVVSFSPMHHWTDQRIRVHVFYCVLALAVAHLMRREAEHAGLHLSVGALLHELSGIEETVLLHHDGGKGRPRTQRLLTDMTDTQRRLADIFAIDRYARTR